MKKQALVFAALLCAALFAAAACSGPVFLLPGGALQGETKAAPADWAFSDAVETVQLETRPADPYSVNIWVTALGPKLYVHAGANRAEWVGHMEADPKVRLRISGALYELSAARVTAQEEFDAFADVYEKKYGSRPRNENAGEAYLFALTPR